MITKIVLMNVLDLYPISLYVVPLPASQLTATMFISTELVQTLWNIGAEKLLRLLTIGLFH